MFKDFPYVIILSKIVEFIDNFIFKVSFHLLKITGTLNDLPIFEA